MRLEEDTSQQMKVTKKNQGTVNCTVYTTRHVLQKRHSLLTAFTWAVFGDTVN